MEINSENLKLLVTEIGIMKTSRHENIVQYVDSYIVEEKQVKSYFVLLKNCFFIVMGCYGIYGWRMSDRYFRTI